MKTVSIIIVFLLFGTFGWVGLENNIHKSELPKKEVPTTADLKIRLAENNCAKLELEIQEKQCQISEILKQQP